MFVHRTNNSITSGIYTHTHIHDTLPLLVGRRWWGDADPLPTIQSNPIEATWLLLCRVKCAQIEEAKHHNSKLVWFHAPSMAGGAMEEGPSCAYVNNDVVVFRSRGEVGWDGGSRRGRGTVDGRVGELCSFSTPGSPCSPRGSANLHATPTPACPSRWVTAHSFLITHVTTIYD